jgi:hypothetical protein
MTDLTARLDAIQARLDEATPTPWDCDGFADGDIVNLSLYEGTNQGRVIAEGITRHGDADLLRYAPYDIGFLLVLARKQQAALDAVTELTEEWDVVFEKFPAAAAGVFAKSHANRIREALEAKP